MERIPRGVYTQKFRQQAVKLVEDEGLTAVEAARRLSIPVGSLKNWLAAARAGKLQEVGKKQKPLTEAELELARPRKELAEVKQERDLLKKFAAEAPGKAWTTDITYVATDEGWLSLAGVKDLFSGELVGYAMSERMTKALVMQALFRAVAIKRPAKGLLHHSDRGSQYCAHDYQDLLKQFGMVASMSRKGNCWDNAPMESSWGTLETELVHHRRFATREQARQEITEHIEILYNRMR